MNKQDFYNACNEVIGIQREKYGIGTLSEKTLHAVLKQYFEPNLDNQEIKIGGFVADIVGENGIIEIQTQGFNKLRKKLENFLAVTKVTVVYPIAKTKWLYWIDKDTSEITKKRKSPKFGTPYQVFFELYKIKYLLTNPNFQLCIVMLDLEEYRNLDGYSNNKKKGSSRYERIPVDIHEQIYYNNINDYRKFIPETLPELFTTKDYAAATKLNLSNSQTALNVLFNINAVTREGKKGNLYLYKRK